jgi:hypothetical protein
MPMQIAWDTEVPNTILYTLGAYWTWDEYFRAFKEEQIMGESLGSTPYFTIGDMTRARLIPHGPLFNHLSYSFLTSPPNFQHAFIVTTNSVIVSMLKLAIQTVPHVRSQMTILHMMTEARSRIRELQASGKS